MTYDELVKAQEDFGIRLEKVVECIPIFHKDIRNFLKSKRESLMFAAPEVAIDHMQDVGMYLDEKIGNPANLTEEWQKEVFTIFTSPIEDVKKM